jgi:hypothetical protein
MNNYMVDYMTINVEVVKQFAENLAGNMTGVDSDIQQIVDEHFWEML